MSDTSHLHREGEHSYHRAVFTQPVSGYEYDTHHHSLRKRSHALRYATVGVSGLAVVSLVWWLNNSDAFYAQDNRNLSLQENIANKLAQLPQSLGQSITPEPSPTDATAAPAEKLATANSPSWSPWLHLNVKPGDTLLVIFERNHLNTDDMYQILEVADYADNLHSLYPNQEIRIKRDANDGIDELTVALDLNTELHIFKNDAGFGGEIMQFNERSGRMQVVTDPKILAQYGGDDVAVPEVHLSQVETPPAVAVAPPAKVVAKAPVKLTAQEVAKVNKEVKIATQAATKAAKSAKESKNSKENNKVAAKETAKQARAKAIAEATAKKAAHVAAAEEAATKKAAQVAVAQQEAAAKKAARIAQKHEERKKLVASMREVSRRTAPAPAIMPAREAPAPVREVVAAVEPRRAVRQEVASAVTSVRQSFAQLTPRPAAALPSPSIEPVHISARRRASSDVGTTVFDDVDSRYSTSSDPKLSKVVDSARGLLGTRYVFGGTTPKGFDCSGFVRYNAQKAGASLPRTAREQYSATKAVSKDELRPGDLVFFNTRGRGIGHVGIYVGDNNFIHAPNRRKTVQVTSLNNKYYKQRYVRGGRL
jgi:cell wall-associated NlpC family hydrolase